ncbi:hypothetical protein D3C78_1685990 [compost metagenome]
MPLNICRGKVACSGPARNSVTTTSSNEVAKANSAPEITPGAISGKVTRRNAVSGEAPRLAAARTRLWLNPCKVADTVMITNGTPSTACTTISEKKLLPRPSGAKNR